MKIPRELPRFEHERVLLIVTGATEALFFLAWNGAINPVARFNVEKPIFTDRKVLVRRGRGRTIASGAGTLPLKERMKADFLRQFELACKPFASRRLDHVYLFTPAYFVTEVQDRLPVPLDQKLSRIIRGDFSHEHPLVLLERLGAIHDRAVSAAKRRIASPEAKRLLGRR